MTFTVSSGQLSMTAPASANLGTGAPGDTLTGHLGNVEVLDNRAADNESWTATAAETDFVNNTNPADTIPASDATYSPGAITTVGSITVTGTNITLSNGTRSELTTWIRVQHPVLRLRPGQTALDRITSRVPRVATRGEHYGVIWVQQSATLRRTDGSQIREISRVGVRIYLAVGRGGAPPTQFRITSLAGRTTPAGRPVLVARVANTGGRAVDLTGKASLAGGPGGASVSAVSQKEVLTLAPGQSGSLIFPESKGLPDGPWHADVTQASGFTHASVALTISFSGDASGGAMLPWVLWVPGLVIGLLILAVALLRYGPLAGRGTPGRWAAGARRRAVLARDPGKQEA